MEYANDEVIFPEQDDYWTGNPASDLLEYQNAMWQAQRSCVFTDANLTYSNSLNITNILAIVLSGEPMYDDSGNVMFDDAGNLMMDDS